MHDNVTNDGTAVAKRIGLTLPPSARVEHAEPMRGMDDAARLSLVMSSADWQGFSAQIAKQSSHELTFSEDDNFLLGTQADGWKPGEATGLKTGQVLWANGTEGLNVGVAPEGSDMVRVFLFWHQT